MKTIGDYLEKNYNKHLPEFRKKIIKDTANEIAKDIVKEYPDADFEGIKKDINKVLLKEANENKV